MLLAPRQRLLFIGDSITDALRERPVGESCPWSPAGAGTGYVHMVNALLGAWAPHLGIRVLNVGVAGNTVRDLEARWKVDVEDLKPDWLSVMIGINDVWRQFDSPSAPERAVDLEAYESTLNQLLARTRPSLQGLVVMSPFVIEKDGGDPMRKRMQVYGEASRRLAKAHDAVFVDVQAAFDLLLEHQHECAVAWDRIHPLPVGHMAIARAFTRAVGLFP